MARDWDDFLWAADEWIVNYSLPIAGLTSVKLFSVGHAFELYLKACSAKMTGDLDTAVKFSHDLPTIWDDCKRRDPSFLPTYELKKSVLEHDLLDYSDYSNLPKDDLFHFLHFQEMYVAAKYLADLKYLGAPLKKVKGAYAIATIFPNPLWAELFRALREYLGHPKPGKLDLIQHHVEHSQLPSLSIDFLNQILVH